MSKISVVIITFNEENNIFRCIRSVVGLADEIVIVDSYSEDSTVEICKSLGAKVYLHHFEGYREQKNYAMSLARFRSELCHLNGIQGRDATTWENTFSDPAPDGKPNDYAVHGNPDINFL